MKRQENRTRRRTLYPTLFLGVWGIFFSGVLFSDSFESARKNPILRDYFLQQQIRYMSYIDFYGRMRYQGDIRLLEQQVDRNIDNFLTQVTRKLDALKAHLNTVRSSQEETPIGASNDKLRRKARTNWQDELKEMAEEAKDLRKMLSRVFRGLDNKSDFQPRIEADADNPGFQKEIRFIEEQIEKAEQQIKDYLFVPTHTVHVQDLQGQNMMIYLYRVEKTSKKLSEEIPPNRW